MGEVIKAFVFILVLTIKSLSFVYLHHYVTDLGIIKPNISKGRNGCVGS